MRKMFMKFILASLACSVLLCVPGLVRAVVRPNPIIQADLEALFKRPPAVSGFPYQDLVTRAALKYGLPEAYILAVARGESLFDPKARSNKGAMGIMQVMPSTASEYGVSAHALIDPAINIDVGVHYLADLYTMLQDPYLALAAYYCGPACINKETFGLRSDCNRYVNYIHTHLQKVLRQKTGVPSEPSAVPAILASLSDLRKLPDAQYPGIVDNSDLLSRGRDGNVMNVAETVKLNLQVIQTGKEDAFVDPRLDGILPDLQSEVRFSSYRQIKAEEIILSVGSAVTIRLPGVESLNMALEDVTPCYARIAIQITRSGQVAFNTTIETVDEGSSLIGGPLKGDGMILLRITTRI